MPTPSADVWPRAFPLRPAWGWRALAGVLAFVVVLVGAVALAAAVAFGFTSGFAGIFTLACALVPGPFLVVRVKRPIERGLGRRWNRVTVEQDGTLTLRAGRWSRRLRLRLADATRVEHGRHEYVTSTTVNQRPMKIVIRTAHLLLADPTQVVVLIADDWGGEGATTGWPALAPPDTPAPAARMYAADLVGLVAAIDAIRAIAETGTGAARPAP